MSIASRQPESRPAPPSTAGALRPKLRVALCQIAPALGDRDRNIELHLAQIERARRERADLIVFPELSLTGYFLRDMVPDVALPANAPELERLAKAAGNASLVLGFVEEAPHDRFYNSALYAEAGQIVHIHRKVFLPTYGMFDEKRYFAPGDRLRAFDAPRLGRVGLLVCEDLWHLSAIAVMQAEEIDFLICIANSPARGVEGPRVSTAETYDRLTRCYAETLGATVVLAHRVGFEDGLCFWGGSMVVGPSSEVLARAPYFDESLLVAEFDLADLRRQRLLSPLGRDTQLMMMIEELQRIKRRRYEH